MDSHLLGSLHQLHRRLDELTGLVKQLSEEVKEIRETGVPINFQIAASDEEEEEESEDESEEESEGSGESANTWP